MYKKYFLIFSLILVLLVLGVALFFVLRKGKEKYVPPKKNPDGTEPGMTYIGKRLEVGTQIDQFDPKGFIRANQDNVQFVIEDNAGTTIMNSLQTFIGGNGWFPAGLEITNPPLQEEATVYFKMSDVNGQNGVNLTTTGFSIETEDRGGTSKPVDVSFSSPWDTVSLLLSAPGNMASISLTDSYGYDTQLFSNHLKTGGLVLTQIKDSVAPTSTDVGQKGMLWISAGPPNNGIWACMNDGAPYVWKKVA